MAYYIEIRPRGTTHISVEAFKQRFFDLGLQPHPALACETETQEIKDKYRDDIVTSVGVITVQEWAASPCGISSLLRVSWGYDLDGATEVVSLMVQLAELIDADVLGPRDAVISHENIATLAQDFAKGKRIVSGALGTCQPSAASTGDMT